jgi:hypothetical protein
MLVIRRSFSLHFVDWLTLVATARIRPHPWPLLEAPKLLMKLKLLDMCGLQNYLAHLSILASLREYEFRRYTPSNTVPVANTAV